MPAELRPAADWFFRGDIALGMNVVPLVCGHGWHTAAGAAAGVGQIEPNALAATMLRSPDATPAQHRQRDRHVARILAGKSAPATLLPALQDERFDASAAEALLHDPVTAASEFTRLLDRYGRIVSSQNLDEPLRAAAAAARTLLDEASLDDAAKRLFAQWRFHDLTAFDSVVLIASHAIAPFLSVRVTTPTQALIVFPVQPTGQPSVADLVSALKAIAHPQRLEILRITASAPTTGQALARGLGLTEATVHHHTSLLRAAGLITSHRDTHRVYFTAAPDRLDQVLRDVRRRTHAAGE